MARKPEDLGKRGGNKFAAGQGAASGSRRTTARAAKDAPQSAASANAPDPKLTAAPPVNASAAPAKTAPTRTRAAAKAGPDAAAAGPKTAKPRKASARPTSAKTAAKSPATKATATPATPAAPQTAAKPAAKTAAKTGVKTAKAAPKAAAKPAAKAAKPAGQTAARSAATSPAASSPRSAKLDPTPKPAAPVQAAAPAPGDLSENPFAISDLPARLAENIERIENLGQRLLFAMASRPIHAANVEGPGPEFIGSVAQGWLKLATDQPARIIEQQVKFWGQTLRHVAAAQDAFARSLSAPDAEGDKDNRFKNPLWETNPFYSFVKTQYQINAEALRQAASDLQIDDVIERRRVEWFTRQMIDMLAPTNFLATNPDALSRAIETEGESLVRGLENLVRDVEHNGGELMVSLADRDAFQVGENIGTTPGEVVYRTDMLELIQFHPTTETVHRTPVLVFPPWINKYYIMDLKPQNSLLRWLVGQGHTLFVVSWKNPDAGYADTSMDDYVSAYLDVIGKVLELTEEPQLNAVGYCIAGTTLSATLALMKQRGDDRVKTATFFTTLTDFSDQGEFTTFLQDDFVGGIEDEVARTGYLSARLMQRTFSFLRANDLVWGPAIRSYMMGDPPPAFDLLFWNGDGTNLPGKMVTQYLRELCQKNALVEGGFEILGHRVHLSEVTVPLCAVACEGDHIAPWLHSWKGVAQMGAADKTFILSESGHIAGIINPPSKVKYGHYTSTGGFGGTADAWRAAAEFHEGSWWGLWGNWLAEHAGSMVPSRQIEHSLAAAPGTYVLERA